ncbi:response regulator [Clostridium weizhouense]|uniref:Transcriptional regulatory protein n=1 Tax=Clostridium weizhouense TaxID=2859781 RepID=A0ABS7ASU1_9CLOT|nr:response regulator [Clostridium weizhouense]MBW6411752.1 response regulator [Clostridium weizhouense]
MIKVLIVEDDPMVALINKTYLEKIQGIKVFGPEIYENEIIDVIEKEEIDLILLDVFLPYKSGIEILKSLRGKKYLQDIIMITAANSVEELKMAYAYGVIDYLIKPFEFKRFEEAINKYKIKHNMLSKEDKITQKELDSVFSNNTNEALLPKGLNKRTLDKIINFLKESDNKIWTLREISYELSISNVTIKKYMDYLESIGSVWVEMNMGNIGRPEMKYYINL